MSGNKLTLEQLWKDADFKPNPAQAEAIQHIEGPLYLTAGPGSGKTRVLLWRALNLIVFHEVRPEEIFLSTFTEKAALQLREGLRMLLGMAANYTDRQYDTARMYVGTVHSLCQQLITDRRFSPGRSRARAPVLTDELGQYLYLYKASQWKTLTTEAGLEQGANATINECFGESSVSRHQAVSNCISFFNRLSEECIEPEEARARLHNRSLRKLIDLYAAYKASLESDALTDFALLQQKGLQALESFAGAERVFQHVIIDEYQDTNTIQEKLFFKLAGGHKNICVVGDDDQALYRFRGATVENFVEFPDRCKEYLDLEPRQISLVTNYRSRQRIVGFYTEFIDQCDWSKEGRRKGAYRVPKAIRAANGEAGPSVVASTPAKSEDVCAEIADLVRGIIDAGKVQDPNQIAFLYPSLKSRHVKRMIDALETVGLKVYAPRANSFLQVDEAVVVFGLYLHILGRPERGDWHGRDLDAFYNWLDVAYEQAEELIKADSKLKRYIQDRQDEIQTVIQDHTVLKEVVKRRKWEVKSAYEPAVMREALSKAAGLSRRASKSLASPYFERIVLNRQRSGQPPFWLSYVINRATALDWNVLDLFYQLCGFQPFQTIFEQAEKKGKEKDEGPVCNLSLISQYLGRFTDEYASILSGEFLSGDQFVRTFFSSYLYALFRRGESEYEDAEDPFPRGRIPFLTIHQAKGLEFPVVVLGNPSKINRGPQQVEQMVHPLLEREGEPLERMAEFDIMRMFYVALSRAKNLLVIAHYQGAGASINEPFRLLLNDHIPCIPDFDVRTLPVAELRDDVLPKTYSYTGDYLAYERCPRQYMIFRKYGFVPSRSQTMFFGSLVHQTIEDLHQHLIAERTSKRE